MKTFKDWLLQFFYEEWEPLMEKGKASRLGRLEVATFEIFAAWLDENYQSPAQDALDDIVVAACALTDRLAKVNLAASKERALIAALEYGSEVAVLLAVIERYTNANNTD